MKTKLLTAILSLTLVFSATQITMVSASDLGANLINKAANEPGNMLPEEGEVPGGTPGNMLPDEDVGVGDMLPEEGETPEDPGASMLPEVEETPNDDGIPFPETDNKNPTVVPSTGVTMLAKLF